MMGERLDLRWDHGQDRVYGGQREKLEVSGFNDLGLHGVSESQEGYFENYSRNRPSETICGDQKQLRASRGHST